MITPDQQRPIRNEQWWASSQYGTEYEKYKQSTGKLSDVQLSVRCEIMSIW